ncbi:MAG: FGGY family carbohydrate kinase, partial [Thermoprotei archaeon]
MGLVHTESIVTPVRADGSHDAALLLSSVRHFILKAKEAGVKSVGLATYRASMVAWDRSGRPLSDVLTWLSPKSAEVYRRLPPHIRLLSRVPPLNLLVAPYSPTLRYLALLEDIRRRRSSVEDILIWTLESFLVYALTHRYVGDATNSTMTGFVHPSTFRMISAVGALLGLRPELPEIVDNTEHIGVYEGVEINALAADQQAACVGEACLSEGTVKVTNGTGTFVDIPSGRYKRVDGLIPIVVVRDRKSVVYGVEGYLPTSGLAVDLLKRMGVLSDYSELDSPLEGDVLFVPAL